MSVPQGCPLILFLLCLWPLSDTGGLSAESDRHLMCAEVFTHLLCLPRTAGGKGEGKGSSSCLTFWGWGDVTHTDKQPHL